MANISVMGVLIMFTSLPSDPIYTRLGPGRGNLQGEENISPFLFRSSFLAARVPLEL